jgi:hypothetical protein
MVRYPGGVHLGSKKAGRVLFGPNPSLGKLFPSRYRSRAFAGLWVRLFICILLTGLWQDLNLGLDCWDDNTESEG